MRKMREMRCMVRQDVESCNYFNIKHRVSFVRMNCRMVAPDGTVSRRRRPMMLARRHRSPWRLYRVPDFDVEAFAAQDAVQEIGQRDVIVLSTSARVPIISLRRWLDLNLSGQCRSSMTL